MKLSEYVYALCSALETEHKDGQPLTMSLLPEHRGYRQVISKSLQQMFLGGGAAVIDELFKEGQQYLGAYRAIVDGQKAAEGATTEASIEEPAKSKRAAKPAAKK